MSAIMLLSLYFAHSGGHIVSSNRLYGGGFHWFREFFSKLGIAVTFVENPQDIEEWKRAIRPETKFLALENPSNPLIDVFDPRPIAKLAHREGKKFIVD